MSDTTPTPRTDAAVQKVYVGKNYGTTMEHEIFLQSVPIDFARQLERELNTLITAIRDECNIPEGIRQALISVTKEDT